MWRRFCTGGAGQALTELLLDVSRVHGTLGILVLTAVFAGATWRCSDRIPFLPLVAAVPGGLLLNVVVKHAVQRPRPQWGYALQSIETYSFPSGHTAGATLFYGMVLVWLWRRHHAWGTRIAFGVVAFSMVALVATSRIVLGVHYLTDCIAAVVEAGLWLGICLGVNPSVGQSHATGVRV